MSDKFTVSFTAEEIYFLIRFVDTEKKCISSKVSELFLRSLYSDEPSEYLQSLVYQQEVFARILCILNQSAYDYSADTSDICFPF